jgi:hypothetical protein
MPVLRLGVVGKGKPLDGGTRQGLVVPDRPGYPYSGTPGTALGFEAAR